MKRQYGICRQLARDKPELADEFRAGDSYGDLAKKYLPGLYHQKPKAARGRVMHAVHYLMEEREREKIGREHIRANNETFCRDVYKDKRGAWAPYNAEKLQNARKKGGEIAGKKVGKKNYRAGKGIANLTHEQLVAYGKKAALKRGEVPFEWKEKYTPYGRMNEKKFILYCVILKEYTWEEIRRQANQIWHNNRAFGTIRTIFNENWKPKLLEQLVEEGIPIPDCLIRKKYRLKIA